jgi:chaperone required for assembly of F1-ATPase
VSQGFQAKRFYKQVAVEDIADGWQVLLDGRALKSPAGLAIAYPTRALAEAIAAEWDAQQQRIETATMPLFKLLSTAIDRVGPRRSEVAAASLKFAETDMLCYRADAPAELVARQASQWDPLLNWARDELGAELHVISGILPVPQPERALASLRRALDELDEIKLTGISQAAAAMGSLVLGLALARKRIEPDEAAELAMLDELFQVERWGEDAEARERRARVRAEIVDAARFLDLV